MKLPKLAVDTKQLLVEGALTNAWLEKFGVVQGRESAEIDVAKLAAAGVDVHALAKTAELRGHPGTITLDMLQSLPDKALAQVGAQKRNDVAQADAKVRASAFFDGVTGGLGRATAALDQAARDLEAIAKEGSKLEFNAFLDRLGPDSRVMAGAKLLRAVEKQLDSMKGQGGSQMLWASTQSQRDAVWPAAKDALAAYQRAFAGLAAIGESLGGMEMGEAVLRSQALATIAQQLNDPVSEIAQTIVYFRSADELAAEAKAQNATDRVLEARMAFAVEYARSKGWPVDPAELSIDQIKEIRGQEAWIQAGRA